MWIIVGCLVGVSLIVGVVLYVMYRRNNRTGVQSAGDGLNSRVTGDGEEVLFSGKCGEMRTALGNQSRPARGLDDCGTVLDDSGEVKSYNMPTYDAEKKQWILCRPSYCEKGDTLSAKSLSLCMRNGKNVACPSGFAAEDCGCVKDA